MKKTSQTRSKRGKPLKRTSDYRLKKLALLLACSVFLVCQFFIYYFFYRLPITFNSEPLQARRGDTVAKLITRTGVKLKKGNFISVSGHVLKEGGGKPPIIEINQQRADLDYVLRSGDSVFVSSGTDIQEKVVRQLELISPPTVYEGEGAFITLATRGQPGLKITTRGKVSGELADEKISRPPQPAIIRRFSEVPSLVVALTFDDGPDPVFTPQILSILKNEGAAATFFVLGTRAQSYPEIVQQEIALGHTVGNHSFSHPDLGQASQAVIEQELMNTEAVITQITGNGTKWFRPPKGSVSPLLVSTIAARGYRLVLWDVDPWDWSKPSAEAIYQRVVTRVKPGSVVLLHDGGGDRSQTVAALPLIINLLRSQGYYFVTLDQLPAR